MARTLWAGPRTEELARPPGIFRGAGGKRPDRRRRRVWVRSYPSRPYQRAPLDSALAPGVAKARAIANLGRRSRTCAFGADSGGTRARRRDPDALPKRQQLIGQQSRTTRRGAARVLDAARAGARSTLTFVSLHRLRRAACRKISATRIPALGWASNSPRRFLQPRLRGAVGATRRSSSMRSPPRSIPMRASGEIENGSPGPSWRYTYVRAAGCSRSFRRWSFRQLENLGRG